MASVIEADVRADIGGDEQRVTSVHTTYQGAQFRYLLAPSWSGEYDWKGKEYALAVNAETGRVSGQRPWSWLKIGLAATVIALVAVFIGFAVGTTAAVIWTVVVVLGVVLTVMSSERGAFKGSRLFTTRPPPAD